MKRFSTVIACAAFCLFAGCAQQQGTATATLNSTCVVSGKAIDASAPMADYQGGKIGFCCDKCITKWTAMDDAGKKAALDAHVKK